ncbi:MAG: DUF6076 domain-containing protein [Clostridiales bacterium]|nr:MAG: DUF6076 domain-containing protein [Clostridiales bacterium]
MKLIGLQSFRDCFLVEMMHAILHNIPILKVPGMQKDFFIAENHGIQYCDNIYKDGKTCRQIGAKKQFKEKVKSDSALSLYEKKVSGALL